MRKLKRHLDPNARGDESDAGEPSDSGVSEAELFEALANRRRRYVLDALSSPDDQWELGTLAEHVAARENDTTVEEVSAGERKATYTALQQLHLPKLDDRGLVDYDRDRGTVRATKTKENVDVYLDVVRGEDIPWSAYYVALALVGAAFLTASGLGIYPFSLLPDIWWAALVVAAFLVSSIVHYRVSESIRARLSEGDGGSKGG